MGPQAGSLIPVFCSIATRGPNRFKICAIVTKHHGSIFDEDGLDLKKLIDIYDSNQQLDLYPRGAKGLSADEIIRERSIDVVIEATTSNLETGQPGLDHCLLALAHGKHVVTTNKGPIALSYERLGTVFTNLFDKVQTKDESDITDSSYLDRCSISSES